MISVEGKLVSEMPSWLFDQLGNVVTINVALQTTTIIRDVTLWDISVNYDDESWTITGEILNSRGEK